MNSFVGLIFMFEMSKKTFYFKIIYLFKLSNVVWIRLKLKPNKLVWIDSKISSIHSKIVSLFYLIEINVTNKMFLVKIKS